MIPFYEYAKKSDGIIDGEIVCIPLLPLSYFLSDVCEILHDNTWFVQLVSDNQSVVNAIGESYFERVLLSHIVNEHVSVFLRY